MRFFFNSALLASVALHLGVLAAPTDTPSKVPITKVAGPKITGSYIVTLKEGASRTPLAQKLGSSATVYEKSVLNGFAAKLSSEQLEEIRLNPDVASIEEDGVVHALGTVTQTNAPWGLGRISQNPALTIQNPAGTNFVYKYDSLGTASGVDVYVIDTGINTAHTEFGGRAVWGANFGGGSNTDGNGHGTHLAGIIGGTQYGVAKSVKLIAVKVLGDNGSGSTSQVISGLNYVISAAQASGRPSIVNISIGGSASTAVDNAVNAVINAGIPVVVAAGGSNTNVSGFSPARVPNAITVASSDIADRWTSFNNYGAGIDIVAPGVSIISAWYTSNTVTATLSGSSMSAAFVSGLVAYFTSKAGGSAAAGVQGLFQYAVPNVLSGVPAGTVNLLANNEF